MNRLLQQQSALMGRPYSLDLSRFPASATQRRVAAFAAALPFAISATLLPISDRIGPTYVGFIPAFNSAILVVYAITAYLLYRQSRDGASPALIVLASAYLFNSAILVAQIASYPRVFGPNGLFGAHTQTSAWLWCMWHASFPLFVIAYAAVDGRCVAGRCRSESARLAAAAVIGTVGLAAICIVVAFRLSDALPTLIVKGSYVRMNRSGVGPSVILINAAALAFVWARTKGRNVIHLWLVVTVMTMLLDTLLSQTSGHRFSIGWYASRAFGFGASLIVLGALLNETGKLGTLISIAEHRLRTVVAGVTDALVALDENRAITWLNPAAETLFGYALTQATELRIDDLFDDTVAAQLDAGTFEALARKRNGDRFPIEAAFGSAPGEGRIATIMIARDITQRKLAETEIARARDRALEAARAKATFLATMSHEIRTPINAVIGMSELLAGGRLTGEEREFAQTIRESADALLSVVNDILEFSKLEAGKIALDLAPFEPRSTIESAAEMLAVQARRKGLTLLTYVAPDVPQKLIGDEHRMRQILLNLIGNAVKFTEFGNVVVRAFVDRTEGDDTVLRISVTDTGIGLSAGDVDRLFAPFTQADGSTTRRFGGTGLGLSISKGLVEAMGGRIAVESSAGGGSTFTFTARFVRIAIDDPDEPNSPLHGVRCLIVDDDAATCQIVRQYLLSWGMVGTATENEAQAMRALEAARVRGTPYDVAIIDGSTPATEEFARRLVADPTHTATKIIFIGAADRPPGARDAASPVFRAVIHKPLRESSLFDAIAVVTERRRSSKPEPSAVVDADLRDDVAILVVEDNPVNQRVALQQLKRLGYRARAVNDGRAAIEATASERFSLVLMDCQMPGIDGFEATRRIRAAERSDHRTPIVAMTAGALEGDREQCLAAGMDDYLSKPVQLARLRATIVRWTAQKDAVVAH